MAEKNIAEKLKFEKQLLLDGYKLIAGIDEVGRGPLAGPVVTACVIMPLQENDLICGIDDSKKVSEKKREMLYDIILEKAIAVSITQAEADEIDEINILQATKKCMEKAIATLKFKPDVVLVDAMKLDSDVKTVSIIKGDALSYSIGAASIVAKVYRDRLMRDYAFKYPKYGFEKNKGYGTKEHIEAIKENGPCLIHRRTFIKNFWE